MNKYHCCAACVHFRVKKSGSGTSYQCARLGYETKPEYRFDCWEPKEAVKKRMAKER